MNEENQNQNLDALENSAENVAVPENTVAPEFANIRENEPAPILENAGPTVPPQVTATYLAPQQNIPIAPQTFAKPAEQPVAYTAEGQPLYAAPQPEIIVEQTPVAPVTQPQEAPQNESSIEHEGKENAIDPEHPERMLSEDEMEKRCADSRQKYPFIQFLPNEYVAIDVARTSFGYLKNWVGAIVVFVVMILLLVALPFVHLQGVDLGAAFPVILLGGLVLTAIASAFAAIATYVFKRNHLLITNERVFRREQLTPFAFNDQNIELAKVENCSFSQDGLVQQMFDYGTISLKTVGDESTYNFDFASDPKDQFQIVNLMVQEAGGSGGK